MLSLGQSQSSSRPVPEALWGSQADRSANGRVGKVIMAIVGANTAKHFTILAMLASLALGENQHEMVEQALAGHWWRHSSIFLMIAYICSGASSRFSFHHLCVSVDHKQLEFPNQNSVTESWILDSDPVINGCKPEFKIANSEQTVVSVWYPFNDFNCNYCILQTQMTSLQTNQMCPKLHDMLFFGLLCSANASSMFPVPTFSFHVSSPGQSEYGCL